jgi:hypothetical protein
LGLPFEEAMLNLLKMGAGLALVVGVSSGLAAIRTTPGLLTPADQVRLAILQKAISQTVHSDLLVCLGIVEREPDARPRNPSDELLAALHSAGRIVPLTDCVDTDENNGQRRGALLMEASPLEWRGDKAVKMAVYASSHRLPGAATLWSARLTADGIWEVSAPQAEE